MSAELPVIQYWHSEEVPGDVAELFRTFSEHDPDRPHLLYDEAGAERLIAEHFGERELAAFRACAVPAMQSDYFSYCAVLALGGIYCDVRFRCRSPLEELIDRAESGTLFSRPETGTVINGLFLFRSAGHPLLRLVLEIATLNIERRMQGWVSAVTGPMIFNAMLLMRRTGSFEPPKPFAGRPGVIALIESFERAAVDGARVEASFDGITIDPLPVVATWIERHEPHLGYKQSEDDWANWCRRGTPIFRDQPLRFN